MQGVSKHTDGEYLKILSNKMDKEVVVLGKGKHLEFLQTQQLNWVAAGGEGINIALI